VFPGSYLAILCPHFETSVGLLTIGSDSLEDTERARRVRANKEQTKSKQRANKEQTKKSPSLLIVAQAYYKPINISPSLCLLRVDGQAIIKVLFSIDVGSVRQALKRRQVTPVIPQVNESSEINHAPIPLSPSADACRLQQTRIE
jgi:hypothetical protein